MGPFRRRLLGRRLPRGPRRGTWRRWCCGGCNWQGGAPRVIVASVIVVPGVVLLMLDTNIIIRAKVNTDSSCNVFDESEARMQINNWKLAHAWELKAFRE